MRKVLLQSHLDPVTADMIVDLRDRFRDAFTGWLEIGSDDQNLGVGFMLHSQRSVPTNPGFRRLLKASCPSLLVRWAFQQQDYQIHPLEH